MSEIVLSSERIQRVQLALKMYWLSPFCTGEIKLGEELLSWALQAVMLVSKAYADAYDTEHRIAYQIKTGLPSSPITFARLTTPSQTQFVNSDKADDTATLGSELLDWVQQHVQEPISNLGAQEVRVARLIYTKSGDFTYYERLSDPALYLPESYTWQWSSTGKALEGYRQGEKWFSWYPQGRRASRNQNQLHFHGENHLLPDADTPNRIDFHLGAPAQFSFDQMAVALQPFLDDDV